MKPRRGTNDADGRAEDFSVVPFQESWIGEITVTCRERHFLQMKSPERVIETCTARRRRHHNPPIQGQGERPRIEQSVVQHAQCKSVLNLIRSPSAMPSDMSTFQSNGHAVQAHGEPAHRTPMPIGGQHRL